MRRLRRLVHLRLGYFSMYPARSAGSPALSGSALYAAVWRWHFYAGLFVIPFAVLLAITGAIYLFKPQIEGWLYAGLYNVAPATRSIDADDQVGLALARLPGSRAEAYTPPISTTRSALVRVVTADDREITVAVDPHRGMILGTIDEQWRTMQVVRDLHGTLLAGTAGQLLQELAASWAMVLLVTGLFLWWPRQASAICGVILPRLSLRGRPFWRDLHAVTGFWVSALLIFLVATGLPWTIVSGKIFSEVAGVLGAGNPSTGLGWGKAGSVTLKSDPPGQGWAVTHAEHMAGSAQSMPSQGAERLPLAKVVAMALTMPGISPPFEIRLPVDVRGVFSIVTDSERNPEGMAYVHLDQYSGRVIADVRWTDFGPVARGIALGVSLHEGLYFGLVNQLIGLVACVGLIGMATAGTVMWWRRRPAGQLGVPPAPVSYRAGPAIVGITIALGVIMPLMGASLVLILILDWVLRRRAAPRLAGTALVLLLLVHGHALAQDTSGSQSGPTPNLSLGEVVITATRSPISITNVPASVSVVTSQEIENSSAQELDDVLRLVPGIDLLGYSGEAQHPTSDSIGMRGLGGTAQGISRALVMVDGVPINDPFFGYIQWGRVPLANIDHVEVVRGGGSPLWGNYAEGGVINIITREPTTQGGFVDAGGGSYGTYSGSGYGAYIPDGIMKFQGFGSINGTGGFQQVPDYERAPFNIPTSYRAGNLQLKDTIEPSADLVSNITLNYHHNDQRLETLLDRNSQDIYNATGDIKKTFDNGSSLTATAFYSDSSFSTNNSTYFPIQTDPSATTQSLNEIHNVHANDAGGSLIWAQDFAGLLKRFMVGMDVHYITGVDNTDHFIAPDFTPTFSTTLSHGNQTFAGAFFQGTVAPIDKLEITGSGRFQYLLNTDGYDGSIGGIGAVPDRTYTSFDPRVDVRYALPAGFALRGAYYQSFRAPNIGDQFYTYAAGGFVQLPAPYLKPENLTGGEVGLDYTWQKLRSQFTLYRQNIDNYIVAESTTNPVYSPLGYFVVQNMNIASVQAQGFETEINWDIGAGFSTNIAYTLADSVVKSNPVDPASVGQQVIDVPRDKVGAGLTYQDVKGWKLSTNIIWSSRTAWASPDHTDPGYPGKISADSYFLVNASASYPVTDRVELYVKILNLLDRRYIATSFSAPSAQVFGQPFTVFSGLHVTF
ncbi:MAG TPA: TonB-dependent receptor [Stellaceae bacterium]|nr:TonB-dependent receptor [Stellaceae bacterium]